MRFSLKANVVRQAQQMPYDFSSLSPADFEDLARDLIGRELGIRFEAFAAGPDGGADGRHAASDGEIVLQAKHYVGSPYSALKSRMKRERSSIDQLQAKRYILVTSRALSPPNKKELAKIIGPSLQNEGDIWGPRELNGLLRNYPEIEKAHIKLWLFSSPVLDRVIRTAAHNFNKITKAEIEAKVKVYASNPSFSHAQRILEKYHVVIISGPPGVGKTTLAEMLSYAYAADGWDLEAIRSLDDGFAVPIELGKQLFYFDDFLGRVALDASALSHTDSELARFIGRIRASPNARFILTTRAHIFEEARLVSEHMADPRLDISKYLLDVGIYTRRIKARILYNHLLVSNTPQTHVAALVTSEDVAKIVDHKNYNPRIIEWMTDSNRIMDIAPADYPAAFISALDHPGRLWDTAFRRHIPRMCQHLLFALFFCSEYGVAIDDLKAAYDGLHPQLCAKYGLPHSAKDFEEALHILEGGFITISGKTAAFVNPSLRDYLADYLGDVVLLTEFAKAARLTDWTRSLWRHGEKLKLSDEQATIFARSFLPVAEEFVRLPVWRRVRERNGITLHAIGLSNIQRITLLLELWQASGNSRFAEIAFEIATAPIEGFDAWRDGDDAVELLAQIRDGGYFDDLPREKEFADNLENGVVDMIASGPSSDDLNSIADAVYEHPVTVGRRVFDAITEAIEAQIAGIRRTVADIESESTLEDHIATITKLGERAGLPYQSIAAAVEIVKERIDEVSEKTSVSSAPSFSDAPPSAKDKFDNVALRNLFAPLLDR